MTQNTNLSKLTDMEELNLSLGNFSTPQDAINTVISTGQNEIGNFAFIGSIWIIFFFFVWLFYRPQNNYQLDLARAFLFSAGFCFFLSSGFLLSGLISTFMPVIQFSTITLVSFFIVRKLQKSNG